MSREKISWRERFYAGIIAALCFIAVVLAAAIALEFGSGGERKDAVVQVMSGDATPTPAPLTLRAELPPTAAPTEAPGGAIATPTPRPSEEPEYAFLPVYERAETEETAIAILIDVCADRNRLAGVVQALWNEDVKLTLLPLGQNAMMEGMDEVLRACASKGYEFGNRTWSDKPLYRMEDADMAQEIWAADIAVDYALDREYAMRFFCAADASTLRDVRTHVFLKQLGYEGIVRWTMSASEISSSELNASLQPGNIYRFTTSAGDLNKLTGLIRAAQAGGYRMVTVSELLGYPENEMAEADEPILSHTLPEVDAYEDIYVEQRAGDRSWLVYRIQGRLAGLGYLGDSGVDGVFGAGTSAAVSAFQGQCGLLGSGVATVETQKRLFAADAPVCPIVDE